MKSPQVHTMVNSLWSFTSGAAGECTAPLSCPGLRAGTPPLHVLTHHRNTHCHLPLLLLQTVDQRLGSGHTASGIKVLHVSGNASRRDTRNERHLAYWRKGRKAEKRGGGGGAPTRGAFRLIANRVEQHEVVIPHCNRTQFFQSAVPGKTSCQCPSGA